MVKGTACRHAGNLDPDHLFFRILVTRKLTLEVVGVTHTPDDLFYGANLSNKTRR